MIDFSTLTKITLILTILFFVISIIGILKNWKNKYQLIGISSFFSLLTISFFLFTFVPFTHKIIPGSQKYRVVFDDGATQIVIAVSPKLDKGQLKATLEQAASDLFSAGRLSRYNNTLTIKARALTESTLDSNNSIYLGKLDQVLNNQTKRFETKIEINN